MFLDPVVKPRDDPDKV
ncbi:MAG: palindromic element RPE4 domain-containing protein [Rickettsia aeschlimannii]